MLSSAKEPMQATLDRANQVAVSAKEMIEAFAYTNVRERRMTLIDLSRHLRFDREFPDPKIEAMLLRAIALIRSIESGVPGTEWAGEGKPARVSSAIVAASASAPLRLIDNTIRFSAADLMAIALEHSTVCGEA